MSIRDISGTPFVATVNISAAATPTSFAYVLAGTTRTYTPVNSEKQYITLFSITTTDTAPQLVTIDDGASGLTLFQGYVSTSAPINVAPFPGNVISRYGGTLRGTVAALTAGKFVQVTVHGYVSQT